MNKERFRNILINLKLFYKILTRRKTAFAGFIIFMLYVVAAILTAIGIIPPTPPEQTGWEYMFAPPSLKDFPWYILGTDYLGRPLFLVIVRGTFDILAVAILASIITIGIGTIVGLVAGYKGGSIDSILTAIVDIALNLPTYFLALILSVLLPPEIKRNYIVLAFILSITSWAPLARSIRAQTLSLKRREFIDVARVIGFSPFKIMFKDILPLMAPFIFINMIMSMIGAVFGYTGLAFLGFIPARPENWGLQLQQAIIAGGALYTAKGIYALWAPIIATTLLEVSLMYLVQIGEELFSPALRVQLLGEE